MQLLSLLRHRPDITQKRAAEELDLSASRVHECLHHLAKEGILRLEPHGRRDLHYRLTDLGLSRLDELERQHMAEAGRFVETFTRMASRLVGRAAHEGVTRLGLLAGPALSAALLVIAEEDQVVLVAVTPTRDAATLNEVLKSQRLDGRLIFEDLDGEMSRRLRPNARNTAFASTR